MLYQRHTSDIGATVAQKNASPNPCLVPSNNFQFSKLHAASIAQIVE